MHPCLRLSNLSKLPPSLRKSATAAAQGSLTDILYISDALESIPERYHSLMIPVLHANIDPTMIAPILELLSGSPDITAVDFSITPALLSLKDLGILTEQGYVPPAAFPDLWSRIWQWAEFFDTFHDHLPILDEFEGHDTVFMALFRVFWRMADANTARMISNTPRLRILIGRAWKRLLEEKDDAGLKEISTLLGLDQAGKRSQDDPHFDELIAGAGGTHNDLAYLVVSQMEHAFPQAEEPMNEHAMIEITGLTWLICNAIQDDVAFREALIEQGLVTTLTTVCRSLSVSKLPPRAPDFLNIFFRVLCGTFEFWHRGQENFVEALRAGLLPLVFACGSTKNIARTEENLIPLLKISLPGFAVYLSVLTQIQDSLAEIKDVVQADCFGRSDAREYWDRFFPILKERLRVVEEYKGGSLTALRGCDNLKCEPVSEKLKLKRCSSCLTAYYCSKNCQRIDYKEGGHKMDCEDLADHYGDLTYTFSGKDRAFFRALLNRDYALHREDIAMKLLRFMHAHPLATPCTRFSYTHGPCEITIISSEDPILGPILQDLHELEVRRTALSGGRMQLHFLELVQGPNMQFRLLPMRSSSGALFNGLREIAADIHSLPSVGGAEIAVDIELDLEPYRERVQGLLTLDVIETH